MKFDFLGLYDDDFFLEFLIIFFVKKDSYVVIL